MHPALSNDNRPAPFSPLVRQKVSFEIVSQITQAIANGDLKPGEKLPPEPELMTTFGVGRGSIREAIKILEFGGLAEIHRGEGTYLQDICDFNLLTPLFFSLLWETPTGDELSEYFASLKHAQLVFSTQVQDTPLFRTFCETTDQLNDLYRQKMQGSPVTTEDLGDMLIQQLFAWNELIPCLPLSLLASFSHFVFHRFLDGGKDLSLEEVDWQSLYQMNQSALAAVKDFTPEHVSAYMDARRKSPYHLLISYHTLRQSPDSGNRQFWHRKKREGSYVIFWKLIEAMVAGVYGPGDKLPTELELTEMYGVSRGVVRESTKGMEALGLVEIRSGGTYVVEENRGLPVIFDPKAYGQVIAAQDADKFFTFKVSIRDALLYLACRNATEEERETYQDLTNAFVRSLTSIPQDAQAAYQALARVNGYLDEICHNSVLRRVSKVTSDISSGSRESFVVNTIAQGRQREVAQAYQMDASIITGQGEADIPASTRTKLALWRSVEGV